MKVGRGLGGPCWGGHSAATPFGGGGAAPSVALMIALTVLGALCESGGGAVSCCSGWMISATGRRRFGPEGAIRACRGRLRLGLERRLGPGRSTGLVASVSSADAATVSSGLCTRTLLLNRAEQCAVGLAGGHRPNYPRYWHQ